MCLTTAVKAGTLPCMCPYEPGDKQSDDQNAPKNLAEMGAPTPGETFTENFDPYQYTLVEGPDGMPVEATPPWQSQDTAPIPLTPETVACLPQGADEFTKRAGIEGGLPVCSFYKRQRVHNPQAPERPIIQRFCTCPSLRGINGACMSLDDAGIFDCEFREPPHPKATPTLDRIDHDKITLGRERLKHERATGKVHGYRLFRTPEDVAAGRYVLDEGDTSDQPLNRKPAADPMAEDDPAPDPNAGETR